MGQVLILSALALAALVSAAAQQEVGTGSESAVPTYADTSAIMGEYCELADPAVIEAMKLQWVKTDKIIEGGAIVSINEKRKVSFSCGTMGCTLDTKAHPRIYVKVENAGDVKFYDARGTVTIINLTAMLGSGANKPAIVGCTTD